MPERKKGVHFPFLFFPPCARRPCTRPHLHRSPQGGKRYFCVFCGLRGDASLPAHPQANEAREKRKKEAATRGFKAAAHTSAQEKKM